MVGVGNGGDSGGGGFQGVVRLVEAYEPQEKSQYETCGSVFHLSRRARAQQLAQDQAQVERADMNQLPFEDVLAPAQVTAPQAAYRNRHRVQGSYGKQLLRRRGELVERSFAHYETSFRESL